METLFYTIEYPTVDVDGIKEQTGAKIIRLYKVVDGGVVSCGEIETLPESPYNTWEEIQEYLDSEGIETVFNFTQI